MAARFLDTLLGYWWVLALLGARRCWDSSPRACVRSRRASSEFDDSLGRLAVAGADAAELGAMSATRGFSEPEPVVPAPRATARAAAAPVPESPSWWRRPARTSGRACPPPAPTPAMAAPKHVASDETISSETAINLDQGDPLAEADFHMAYGLYDQAADLIRIAISREPARRDLKLKLLEVFFVWGNKEQFLSSRARAGAEPRARPRPGSGKRSSSWASSSPPRTRCSPAAAP